MNKKNSSLIIFALLLINKQHLGMQEQCAIRERSHYPQDINYGSTDIIVPKYQLSTVPDEIISSIFEYMTFYPDLITVKKCNKRLYRLFYQYFKTPRTDSNRTFYIPTSNQALQKKKTFDAMIKFITLLKKSDPIRRNITIGNTNISQDPCKTVDNVIAQLKTRRAIIKKGQRCFIEKCIYSPIKKIQNSCDDLATCCQTIKTCPGSHLTHILEVQQPCGPKSTEICCIATCATPIACILGGFIVLFIIGILNN